MTAQSERTWKTLAVAILFLLVVAAGESPLPFLKWMKEWQTWLAAGVALIAARWVLHAAREQIVAAERHTEQLSRATLSTGNLPLVAHLEEARSQFDALREEIERGMGRLADEGQAEIVAAMFAGDAAVRTTKLIDKYDFTQRRVRPFSRIEIVDNAWEEVRCCLEVQKTTPPDDASKWINASRRTTEAIEHLDNCLKLSIQALDHGLSIAEIRSASCDQVSELLE